MSDEADDEVLLRMGAECLNAFSVGEEEVMTGDQGTTVACLVSGGISSEEVASADDGVRFFDGVPVFYTVGEVFDHGFGKFGKPVRGLGV